MLFGSLTKFEIIISAICAGGAVLSLFSGDMKSAVINGTLAFVWLL